MTDILRIAALVLLLCFLTYLLRTVGFRGAPLLATVGLVGLIGISVSGVGRIFSHISDNAAVGEVAAPVITAALKLVGVGYVFGTASDICRDLGEHGIAQAALAVGRVEILLISLPYIDELLGLIAELV